MMAVIAAAQKAGLKNGAEQKIDEIPYDFVRKSLSVVTANPQGQRTLITKGALENILKNCSQVQSGNASQPWTIKTLAGIEQRYSDWSEKGFRVLGVATKSMAGQTASYSNCR